MSQVAMAGIRESRHGIRRIDMRASPPHRMSAPERAPHSVFHAELE